MIQNEVVFQQLTKMLKGTNLLALPQSAARVLELSRNAANGPPEYAAAISSDLGLTSQILKFVNSSFFGFQYKITSVQTAMSLVCVRTVKNFVLWNAVFALLPNPKCGPFDLKVLCQDSLRRGSFAKVLASFVPKIDSEELFVCTLLQDMAIPILAQFWPKEYETILIKHRENGRRISDLEQEIFGWNHADAGALLVQEWGFGEEMGNRIAVHTQLPFELPQNIDHIERIMQTIIGLTSMLPSTLDKEWKEADSFFGQYHQLGVKGLPSPADVFASTDEIFTDIASVSHLGTPLNSLVQFHKQYLDSMKG